MVGSEVEPFAKTGGLADVLGALPRALVRLGHEVTVVMPRYRGITAGSIVGRIPVPLGADRRETDFLSTAVDGVRVVFVDRPEYYDRPTLYGTATADYEDNAERFAFLALATVAWMAATGDGYDVVHTHDWQTGLVPALLLRTAAGAGMVLAVVSFGLAAVATYRKLAYGVSVQGWTSLFAGIMLVGGLLLVSVGIIGEYLIRIIETSEAKPTYFVRRRSG